MPATTSRPASERQLSFLRALVDERGATLAEPHNAALRLECVETFRTGLIARDLIDRVIAVPRATSTAAAPSSTDGTLIDTPSDGNRAGRMLAAGGIEATVTLHDGRHVTITVRTRKRSGRGWSNGFPGEPGARTNIKVLDQRVGWVNVDDAGIWHLTLRTRRDEYVNAIRALFAYAAGLDFKGFALRVQEASRCGRCFRTLTDPVSIDRGIGPECLGMSTGSRHVTRGTVAVPATPYNAELAAEAAEDAYYRAESRDFEPVQQSLTAIADALTTPAPETREQRRERVAQTGPTAADVQKARDTIAEALDAYGDTGRDVAFALNIFDQLAAR